MLKLGICNYGRAARYKLQHEHAGTRKCGALSTTEAISGCWRFIYCTEHALLIATTAPQKWTFSGPVSVETARSEHIAKCARQGAKSPRKGKKPEAAPRRS